MPATSPLALLDPGGPYSSVTVTRHHNAGEWLVSELYYVRAEPDLLGIVFRTKAGLWYAAKVRDNRFSVLLVNKKTRDQAAALLRSAGY